MTTRKDLRRQGEAMRDRLFTEEPDENVVPGFDDLMLEVLYGAVWSRPGLALEDRMIASLAALCSVQRLTQLRSHVAAALDLGIEARSIAEIFVQCGIYAGFPASEAAISVAGGVFAERGIEFEEEP